MVRLAVVWAAATGPAIALLLQLPMGAWIAMLVYHAACVAAARGAAGRLGRRPGLRRWVGWALGTAVVVLGLGWLAHASGLQPKPPAIWLRWGLGRPGEAWLLLYYAAINPWIEEWFWRGTLLGDGVRAALGEHRARLLTILGFWPLHGVVLVSSFGLVLGGLLSLACAAAGVVWTVMRERQGQAWNAVASHLGADAAVVSLYWIFLRGSR